ncbi:UvrD-helicase domain-containing protein [Mariprofundus ferrooxydans]|uniref:UvrD-helicase domain-containing protein n=1 Tax=Mariprofundus ferrooxydans TaxID=314344 RepID=UPI0003610E06|nr:UvrD-helicase domain-containing protein [Mariprofundus ferrooxydans]
MINVSEPKLLAWLHLRWPRSITIGAQSVNLGASETSYINVLRTRLNTPWYFPGKLSLCRLNIEYRDGNTKKNISLVGYEQLLSEAKQKIEISIESDIQHKISIQKKWISIVEQERAQIYDQSRYLRHSKASGFASKWSEHFGKYSRLSQYCLNHPMSSDSQRLTIGRIQARLNQLQPYLDDFSNIRKRHNDDYISRYQSLEADFFETVESSPLNENQIKSVLVFDDATLVVAPAGSGKSSCIVAKIGFAIKTGMFIDKEILALSYNKAAAKSLQSRLNNKLGQTLGRKVTVSAKTFHGFGLSILTQKYGKELPSVLKEDEGEEHRLIKLTINSLIDESHEFQSALSTWLMLSAYESPELTGSGENHIDECESRYERCCRELVRAKRDGRKFFEPMIPTLDENIYVRSLEERNIVNWLLLHSVKFDYERPDWDGARILGLGNFKNGKPKPYKPDFTYKGSRIDPVTGENQEITVFHEHFALDANGRAPAWMNGEIYEAYANGKREMFKKRGTLISFFETRSHDAKTGNIFSILERSLRKNGVSIGSQNHTIRQKALSAFRESSVHESLLIDFVLRFKDSGLTKTQVVNEAETSANPFRAKLFLKAAFGLYDAYQKRLRSEQKIDYADMIRDAITLLQNGEAKVPFRFILVDEFQDISRLRADLVKATLDQSSDESLVFCVGDDWQTINRFAGSDVSIFSKAGDYFGRFSEQVFLKHTYRCSQPIADVSKELVMKNSGQFDKDVIGQPSRLQYGIRVVEHGDSAADRTKALKQELDGIVTQSQKIGLSKATVYVLRRTQSDSTSPEGLDSGYMKSIKKHFSSALEIEFHSLHGSKGLEADYVIIPGLESGFRGFPDERPVEPLIELALPKLESLVEEERRLFYVGITRARHQAIVLASAARPSQFLLELKEIYNGSNNVDWVPHEIQRVPCPRCDIGSLVSYGEGSNVSYCTRRQSCGHRSTQR